MNVFDPRHESMPREQRDQLQLERLQALLARLRRNVPRARKMLGDRRVNSLADIKDLPATSPEDLAAAHPYGMFALPLREVIRLHSTVGPGGMQLVIGHTRNDLIQWGRLAARQLVASGGSALDVIQVGFGGGAFAQALGYMLGAELVEASVIPHDAYHTEYQLGMMQSYRASIWITTPTQAHELMGILEARGIDPQSLQLRTVLLSRPIPAEEREQLKLGLFADIRCSFGVSEVLDPGLCVECSEGRLHVNEDHFLVEVCDGELLVTTLAREAMPLLRYRTRTACEIEHVQCPCGRTGVVLRPGKRLDGRLRVNEMPLYRPQVQALLANTRAAGHPFFVTMSEDRVNVSVKVTEDLFADTVRHLEDLKTEIESEFFSRLGIRAQVVYLAPKEFERQRESVEA